MVEAIAPEAIPIASWMINLGIAFVGIIATFAVLRYKINEHGIKLNELDKRSDSHYKDINILKEQHKAHEKYSELHNKHVEEKISDLKGFFSDRFDGVASMLERMEKSFCPK